MRDLYLAECKRFARWAAIAAALHLVALLTLDDFFADTADAELCFLAAAIYIGGSLVFGFYASATYARMNHWIALLHRPLPPAAIMAAIIGAGATVVVGVIALPLAIMTATHALGVDRLVETRHWLLIVGGVLVGLMGFLGGSYAALAPRRYGWTGIAAAAIVLIGNVASGWPALLLPLLSVAVLAVLTFGAFRPDRTRVPDAPVLRAATGATAAFTLYFVLLMGVGFSYHMTLAALGRNALVNAGASAPGGLVQSSRSNGNELITTALAQSRDPGAAALRARLRGVEVVRLPIAMEDLPARGALTSEGLDLADSRRGIAWTYSHDAERFRGLRIKDRTPAGTLAPDGGFPDQPAGVGNGMILSGGDLYRLDPATGRFARRLRLPAGEIIVARPTPFGADVAVLSDRALYLFDRSVLDVRSAPSVAARLRVPLPGLIGDLRRLDAAPLPDRVVVSFFFGQNSIEGQSRAWQRVVSVAPDGAIQTLVERAFAPEFGDALRFRQVWLSPAIDLLARAIERVDGRTPPIQRREPVRVPRGVWIAAILLAVVSAVATAALARRRRLPRGVAIGWTLGALAVGLPTFLAFVLIERRHPA